MTRQKILSGRLLDRAAGGINPLLDVIYHLIEDEIFEKYMQMLFCRIEICHRLCFE